MDVDRTQNLECELFCVSVEGGAFSKINFVRFAWLLQILQWLLINLNGELHDQAWQSLVLNIHEKFPAVSFLLGWLITDDYIVVLLLTKQLMLLHVIRVTST